MKREPQTVGEIGNLIDVSLDHGQRAFYALMQEQGIDHGSDPWEVIYEKYKPGTSIYHLGCFLWYVSRAFRGFKTIGVKTDGQLCPYQDCCWLCGITDQGWYTCPNCKRPFWATPSDSDYEDWHTVRADSSRAPDGNQPKRPGEAQDLGPSWGTPEGNPAEGGDKNAQ